MPYIRIKSFPKDVETKQKVVEAINQIFIEKWGCPPQTISISIEDVSPADWVEQVQKPEMDALTDKMFILNGEKRY